MDTEEFEFSAMGDISTQAITSPGELRERDIALITPLPQYTFIGKESTHTQASHIVTQSSCEIYSTDTACHTNHTEYTNSKSHYETKGG